MRVFVLGAGASKGSQPQNVPVSARAPLIDELFDDVYQGFAHQVGISVDDWREFKAKVASANGSLEQWLTAEWKSIERLRQERTKFAKRAWFGRIATYVWLLLLEVSKTYNETNVYRLFAAKLVSRDEPFGIINFNYDTLMDRGIQAAFGIDLTSFATYLDFGYLKPHGSVNWFFLKRDHEPSPRLYEGSLDTQIRLRIAADQMFNGNSFSMERIIVKRPDHRDLVEGFGSLVIAFGYDHFYPLIFIPLTVKAYTLVDNFFERTLARAEGLLQQAERVVLIGYRARDEIIYEMLDRVKPGTKLDVVGVGEATKVGHRVLEKAGHMVRGNVYENGFLDYIQHEL